MQKRNQKWSRRKTPGRKMSKKKYKERKKRKILGRKRKTDSEGRKEENKS